MFIEDVFINWDKISDKSYLRNIGALSGVDKIHFRSPVTFFVGENGSGKSTLLEAMAIAEGFNPEGGTRNYSFSTYDSHSELCEAVRLSRTIKAKWGYFLRAESFYNVATMEEEYSKLAPYNAVPMEFHKKSHGEGFLSLVQNSFNKKGLYFLDEPEAALSPQRQLTLLIEIKRCLEQGSQFFIVTHSPILLGFTDAEILSFDDGTIHPCKYEETDSFRVTSMFINNKNQILKNLFEAEQ